MSGFGADPFGGGPFGAPYPPPANEASGALASSRLIDGDSRRYVVTDEGGFDSMDDVAQRVMLLLAYGVTMPRFITPETRASVAAQIRAALSTLTSGREPTISILSLSVDDDGRDGMTPRLSYRNLLTGTKQTIP